MSDTPVPTIPKKHQVSHVVALVARAVTFLVYAYVIIVEILLGLGFFLLLFGANPTSGFVEWVYRSLDRTMKPFRGIFEPIEIGIAGNDVPAIFETSILFAMVIYGILAIVLASLLSWLARRIASIEADNDATEARIEYENALARLRGYPDAATEMDAIRRAAATPGDGPGPTGPSGPTGPPPIG